MRAFIGNRGLSQRILQGLSQYFRLHEGGGRGAAGSVNAPTTDLVSACVGGEVAVRQIFHFVSFMY